MFYTDSQLKQALAGVLKKAPSGQDGLPAHWNEIAKAANRRAYARIVSVLLNRGYERSDIDAWDFGDVTQRCLGLYYALTDGGALDDYDDKFIEKFRQCDEELKTVTLVVGDEMVSATGQISRGAMDTSLDRFVQETSSEDGRIGETTQW